MNSFELKDVCSRNEEKYEKRTSYAIGITTCWKAAMYSASPIGLVFQGMFTLNPSPVPPPTFEWCPASPPG